MTYVALELKIWARGFDAGYATANRERERQARYGAGLLAKVESSYASERIPTAAADAVLVHRAPPYPVAGQSPAGEYFPSPTKRLDMEHTP